MRRPNGESLFFEKACHPAQYAVVPAFEEAQKLWQISQKSGIYPKPKQIRAPQAAHENEVFASCPAQKAQHASDLAHMRVGVWETLYAGIRISGKGHDKRLVPSIRQFMRQGCGETSSARDNPDPATTIWCLCQ